MSKLDCNSAELEDNLRLALVEGVGPKLRRALIEQFGSASAVLSAAPSHLREVDGVGPKLTGRLAAADKLDVASIIGDCRAHNISIVAQEDDAYPKLLREIHDPPGLLFVQGSIEPCDALSVAIVGSRHASQYGLAQAERLAGSLARCGFTIVSGLARGIDAAAHRGALSAGGRTLAVLGSGLLNLYPPENAELALDVRAHGALISENPPHSPPLSGAFPQRNRIITGLSLGVIVVEATASSGALISARHAMEQGREVFAVPGRIDSRLSQGCHRLIRDGARLLESADDVIEELGPLVAPAAGIDGSQIHHPAELLLNDIERQVLDAITQQPIGIDAVVLESKLPVAQVLSTISVLEMRRLVRRLSGGVVCRP